MNPLPIVWAALSRNRFTALLFVGLIALAVALGVAISAQERALRLGSARAADRFDLIVAAPGSQTDVLLSVVYLDPTAVELLSPEMTATVLAGERAAFAAPIGFGDSQGGDPVVGTTAGFVDHLSGGLAEGRPFDRINEAVVGALSPHAVGEEFSISHGNADGAGGNADDAAEAHEHDNHAHEGEGGDGEDAGHGHDAKEQHQHDGEEAHEGEAAQEQGHDEHHHQAVTVVGRMKPTGTPWDRAIVVPIEYNWAVHGLPIGHADGETRIGPPFDVAKLPGVPAIVIKPENLAAAYGLRDRYRTIASTAFFPAEVLVDLYAVMGNVARIMAALTLAAQVLVVAAILAGILALLDLQRQRFAVLRALGAPRGFVFATVWLYVAGLIAAGALIGLPLGWAFAGLVTRLVSNETGMAMRATLGLTELALVGALLGLGLLLALIPAAMIYRRPVVEALRG
ncbi:FtsX-like permease family protein [Mesorhizobium sp. IMUNJ 23232]|uniref:FtsX-like permease family protein n=1 Tax=Mesorhizobium sp. IMUNJ 23232 TaxID=3376064 RepID=UPI0037A7B7EA